MKKSCLIIVLAFMFISVGSMEVKAQCLSNLNCGIWNRSFNITYYPTGYPTCPFTVYYDYRKCGDEYQVNITVSAFPQDAICDDLYNDIFPGGIIGGANPFVSTTILAEGYDLIVFDLFADLYDAASWLEKKGFECPNTKTIVTDYNGSCWSLCDAIQKDANGQIIAYGFIKNNCNEAACCIKRYTMCMDMTQTPPAIISSFTTTSEDPQNCDTAVTPACTKDQFIGEGWEIISAGDCEAICPNP